MMKRSMLFITVMLAISSTSRAQEASYIIQRKTFKPPVTAINISPDGKLLMAGFADGSFQVLDPETFESSLEVKEAHTKAITAMDMPPKMDFIMSAGSMQIKTWDLSGQLNGIFDGHSTTIWNAEISRDGKHAVSTAFNKTFLLWDVYEGTVAAHMRGHEDVCLTVCISDNNKLIASGSNDKTIKIWDLESREVITTLHGPTEDIYDVAFSPDSRLVAAASAENSIRIYNIDEEKLIHVLKGHRGTVRKVDFSPAGRFLLSASEDNTLILWDVTKGEKIHPYTDNDGPMLDVKFSPDGLSFYSVSSQGELTRWELHPEIFVLHYYERPYLDELTADPLFETRRKGESKKDYQLRQDEASDRKAEIINRYYNKYLEMNE